VRKLFLIFILCLALLTGCTLAGDLTPPASMATSQAAQPIPKPTTSPMPLPTSETEDVSTLSLNTERGAALYNEKCAACHGESGFGDGPQAKDLPIPVLPIGDPEFARKASPIEWFRVVTEGKLDRYMPGFGSLNDQQRWDVVAYVFSLSSEPMDIMLGAEIFAGLCADCHGLDGTGIDAVPDLTRFEWISQISLDQIVATIHEGISPGMPAFADVLAQDEQVAAARFITNLSFPGTKFYPDGDEATTEEDTPGDMVADALIEAKIGGQISNGTDGGRVPTGIEVTLYGFDGQQPSLTETTQASDSGEYLFEGVEIQPDRVFVTAVEYQGATYGSEVVQIADEFELDLPITIYDTTSDVSQLQVDRLHLIFDMPNEGILQVTELWILSNLGDRTVATELGEGIFEVQLPEGAANLGFESGTSSSRFQPSDETDSFIDRLPIRPGMGSHEIIFSFNLAIDRSLDFTQSMMYPVEAVVLLAPQGVVELEGEMIQDLGLRQMSGTALNNYSAGPISSDDVLKLTVKREKTSPSSSGERNNTLGIVLGISLLVLALGATGYWLDRRNQQRRVGPVKSPMGLEPSADPVDGRPDRESLLQEIANLDDAYEAGKIEEERYRQKRNDLKDQLMEVL
jgi:mono/diheme cytochrome c family protein